jgi:hypothetical protein
MFYGLFVVLADIGRNVTVLLIISCIDVMHKKAANFAIVGYGFFRISELEANWKLISHL